MPLELYLTKYVSNYVSNCELLLTKLLITTNRTTNPLGESSRAGEVSHGGWVVPLPLVLFI